MIRSNRLRERKFITAPTSRQSCKHPRGPGEDLPPEQVVDTIGEYFRSLPPERFPNTFAVMEHLTASDLDERFEFGLYVLVRGLAATARESVPGGVDPV